MICQALDAQQAHDISPMDHNKASQTVCLIGGATASGKSQCAMALARLKNGVIINADSMQMYRDLGRFSAMPSPEDRTMVPHRGFALLGPDTTASVQQWLDITLAACDEAYGNQRLPIIVGGTGLYLRALQKGLSPLPTLDPADQKRVRASLQTHTMSELATSLAAVDPLSAQSLKPNDRQRHTRALEIWHLTGTPLSSWLATPPQPPRPRMRFLAVLCQLDRADLYARINGRFAAMAEDLSSLRAFLDHHPEDDLPIRRILGVNPLVRSLRGRLSLAEAIARGQQHSRNYAKRQLTWFRHQWQADLILSA